MDREGRALIEAGVNPNALLLYDLPWIYEEVINETPEQQQQSANALVSAGLMGVSKQRRKREDGKFDEFDFRNKKYRLVDADRKTILEERELRDGEAD